MTQSIYWLTNFSSNKDATGVRYYSEYLLNLLIKNNIITSLTVFITDIEDKSINHPSVDINSTLSRYNQSSFFEGLYILCKKSRYIFSTLNNSRHSILHINYTTNAFGTKRKTLLIIYFFLIISKLRGIQVFTTLHDVFQKKDIYDNPYIGVTRIVLEILLYMHYALLSHFSTRLIVHTASQKQYLERLKMVSRRSLIVIPHPVYIPHNYSPITNRLPINAVHKHNKTLNLLFFGVFSWYKGLDILIDDFDSLVKSSKPSDSYSYTLTIAGRPHPYLVNNQMYCNWLSSLKCKSHSNIVWIEDIKTDSIIQFLSRFDCLILPYTHVFGASGIIAWGNASTIPLLVSDTLGLAMDQNNTLYTSGRLRESLNQSINTHQISSTTHNHSMFCINRQCIKYYKSIYSTLAP